MTNSDLHENILSKLPISIIGYNNVSDKINAFFSKLIEIHDFKYDEKITFFSYSLAKLKNVHRWDIDALSQNFFFHSFPRNGINADPQFSMSFYTYLKSKNSKGAAHNTINSISKLFTQNINFRVLCNDETTNFSFENNTLSFIINKTAITYPGFLAFASILKESLSNAEENSLHYVFRQNENIFKPNENVSKSIEEIYLEFYSKAFNKNQIINLNKDLICWLKKLVKNQPNLFVSTDKLSDLIEDFVNQVESIAYLSLYYDCCIEYMPAVVAVFEKDENNPKVEERNLGSLIIGYKGDLTNENRSIFKLISERISLVVAGEHLKEQIIETENHAIRAAISQCMARAESHNHGSHILNHLTSYSFYSNFNFDKLKQYSSILKIEKKDSINMQEVVDNLFNLKIKALKNVLSNTEEQKKYIEFTESEPFKEFIEDLKKEFICIIKKNSAQNNNTSQENILFKLLATLIDYIRVRMEYIADISFGVPVMVTTRKFYSEVFRSFDENRLLLNFISGIDIDTFKFRINCESKDGVPLNEKNDISVAFPSDMLSQSAFFNIVENILRNTSKHNQDKIDNKEVTFIINIEPIKSEDDFLKVEIYDNIDLGKVDCKTEKDEEKETIREYFNLSSISEIKKIHEVVFNLNSKLNGTILQNNMIRDHALGLMEMEASCCYLRRLDLINIESNEFNLEQPNHYMINEKNRKDGTGNYNILRAFVKELGRGEEKKHCLGYTFFVLKPKDYLFIGFDKDKEIYKIDGVNHLSNNDLENELKVGKSFDHQFVIYKDISVKEILEKYKYQVTHRWIQIDENDEVLDSNQKIDLDNNIWEKWWDMIKGDFSDVNVLNTTNQNEFNIWLVDHSDTAIKTNEEFDNKTTQYEFVELLSSKAKMTLPEYKTNLANYLEEDPIYNGELCKRIKYKLFESYKSKILILDERVQNIMENENYMKIDYNRLYPKSNIFVPFKSEINLDEQKFDKNYFQKFNDFTDNIKENDFEIIVIHFSLIERLNFADDDKQKFFEKINTKCRKVVVTSGRGIPKEASRYNVSFINLSSLINAVHLTRSKYLLYSILTNTRKINHG